MITIDEEILFTSLDGMEYGDEIKELVLSCVSKGALIRPCENCRFKDFYDIFVEKGETK